MVNVIGMYPMRLIRIIIIYGSLSVVNTVHWDEPIRLQDFSTNQIQGLRSRSQRF